MTRESRGEDPVVGLSSLRYYHFGTTKPFPDRSVQCDCSIRQMWDMGHANRLGVVSAWRGGRQLEAV
ncbi:hypothetical protein BD410DRAFT_794519, partial [Rickenella mellea]